MAHFDHRTFKTEVEVGDYYDCYTGSFTKILKQLAPDFYCAVDGWAAAVSVARDAQRSPNQTFVLKEEHKLMEILLARKQRTSHLPIEFLAYRDPRKRHDETLPVAIEHLWNGLNDLNREETIKTTLTFELDYKVNVHQIESWCRVPLKKIIPLADNLYAPKLFWGSMSLHPIYKDVKVSFPKSSIFFIGRLNLLRQLLAAIRHIDPKAEHYKIQMNEVYSCLVSMTLYWNSMIRVDNGANKYALTWQHWRDLRGFAEHTRNDLYGEEAFYSNYDFLKSSRDKFDVWFWAAATWWCEGEVRNETKLLVGWMHHMSKGLTMILRDVHDPPPPSQHPPPPQPSSSKSLSHSSHRSCQNRFFPQSRQM